MSPVSEVLHDLHDLNLLLVPEPQVVEHEDHLDQYDQEYLSANILSGDEVDFSSKLTSRDCAIDNAVNTTNTMQ